MEKRFSLGCCGFKIFGYAFEETPTDEVIKILEGKPVVDLRMLIEDDSQNIFEYLNALDEVVKKLRLYGEVHFGCFHGCGRTFTVLLMLLGVLTHGDIKKVLRLYERVLRQAREPCPEGLTQLRFAAAVIYASRGKWLRLSDFNKCNLAMDVAKVLTCDEEVKSVEKMVDELEGVLNRLFWY